MTKIKKRYIKDSEFKNMVHTIGSMLTPLTSNWQPDYIVGITRGGLYPALLLSHYLDVPLHTLNVSLRDNDLGPESNLWMSEDAFGYHRTDDLPGYSNPDLRKNILVVDDINDSGATFNWIMDDWRSSCMPNDPAWNDIWGNNVRFAAVVDNQASECRVKMNYRGIAIDKSMKDEWIVFPWEKDFK